MPPYDHIKHTIEHLFRYESGKLISVLTKLFGPHNLQLAEDVVQDTLIKAMDHWKYNGIPENPSAWLFTVARNKALDVIRREKRHHEFASDISHLLKSEYTLAPTVNELMTKNEVQDDQLRMMFTCCHPTLPVESQVALILKTLCGFSIAEIARAFITGNDTIEKRLYRAKQQFRDQKIAFEIPSGQDLEKRIDNVLTAIYLLFNEGYNSTQHEELIRKDLLEEAMRLAELMITHPSTRHPTVYALLALMCFSSARNDARMDDEGNILLLKDQDRNRWKHSLINRGLNYLEQSATGDVISSYHVEAAIASEHSLAGDYKSTNWKNILQYYNLLYEYRPSPIVALNRAIVIAEIHGPAAGIEAIENIEQVQLLKKYYLLPATLGEFHLQLQEYQKAREYFTEAIQLTQSNAEKKLLDSKLKSIR